ncbi:hypothetical protein FBZ91_115137 [Nitrospirillum viridazoti]|nr:hypothetical protein FBZ91_115137 [Nitrospirillum amazonense]
MSRAGKPLVVSMCPALLLAEAEDMDAALELTFLRLVHHCLAAGGEVPDRDDALARKTKAGNRWKRHKAELIAQGLVEVAGGVLAITPGRGGTSRQRPKHPGKQGGKAGENRPENVPEKWAENPPENTPEKSPEISEKSGRFFEDKSLEGKEKMGQNSADLADGTAGKSDFPPYDLNNPPFNSPKIQKGFSGADIAQLRRRADLLASGSAAAKSQAALWPPGEIVAMVQAGFVGADVVLRLGFDLPAALVPVAGGVGLGRGAAGHG